jgi:hypothetical protein
MKATLTYNDSIKAWFLAVTDRATGHPLFVTIL